MPHPHVHHCRCCRNHRRSHYSIKLSQAESAEIARLLNEECPRPPPSPESELVARLQADIKAAAAVARPSDPKELSVYFAHIGGLRKELRAATDALIARNAQYR